MFFQKSSQARLQFVKALNRNATFGGMNVPLEHLKNGVLAGLACGLTSILTLIVNKAPGNTFNLLLTLYIRDSLRNALLGILLSLLLVNNDGLIHRAEVISWSWKRFWQSMRGLRNVVNDLLTGIFVGVVFASKQLFQGSMDNVFSAGVSTGLLVALAIRLISALLQGVSSSNLDNHQRHRANEGIKRSLFHGLLAGGIGLFLSTIFSIITTVIASVLNNGPSSLLHSSQLQVSLNLGFSNALLLGPVGGLLAGLLLGGLAFLQYHILRFVLWRLGRVPWNVLHLLDSATSSLLLHKVGGGYLFAHRFLLEYFASLYRKLARQKEQTPLGTEPPLVRSLEKEEV